MPPEMILGDSEWPRGVRLGSTHVHTVPRTRKGSGPPWMECEAHASFTLVGSTPWDSTATAASIYGPTSPGSSTSHSPTSRTYLLGSAALYLDFAIPLIESIGQHLETLSVKNVRIPVSSYQFHNFSKLRISHPPALTIYQLITILDSSPRLETFSLSYRHPVLRWQATDPRRHAFPPQLPQD